MKSSFGAILLVGMMLPLLVGCGPENYAAAPPPAPPALSGYYYYDQPALAKTARDNGFRDGYSDGARDRDTHSFRPGKDDKYEDCPGYYSEMGSHNLYNQYYRDAYQHGYHNGYWRG